MREGRVSLRMEYFKFNQIDLADMRNLSCDYSLKSFISESDFFLAPMLLHSLLFFPVLVLGQDRGLIRPHT